MLFNRRSLLRGLLLSLVAPVAIARVITQTPAPVVAWDPEKNLPGDEGSNIYTSGWTEEYEQFSSVTHSEPGELIIYHDNQWREVTDPDDPRMRLFVNRLMNQWVVQ